MGYKLQAITTTFVLFGIIFASVKAQDECCLEVRKDIFLLRKEIESMKNVGSFPFNSASSCSEIYDKNPASLSGYYWLKRKGSDVPVNVKCDFNTQLPPSQPQLGWMKIGDVNMKDSSQSCPGSLREITRSDGTKRCGKQSSRRGCESITFKTQGVPFKQVCGRIAGYARGSTDAFRKWKCATCGINDPYVDGISITYGEYPNRQHIWSLVAEQVHSYSRCPCGTRNLANNEQPPSFVGEDLYCEVATSRNDQLWDGQGCAGTDEPCCQNPNLPWFCRKLPDEVETDSIEVRLCLDEGRSNEDIEFESIELYIQ